MPEIIKNPRHYDSPVKQLKKLGRVKVIRKLIKLKLSPGKLTLVEFRKHC